MEEQHNNLIANNGGYNTSSHQTDYIGPPEPKRRIVSGETVVHFEASPLVGQQHATQPAVTPSYYYPVIPRNEARAIVLEDENVLLRKKIEELKKQVIRRDDSRIKECNTIVARRPLIAVTSTFRSAISRQRMNSCWIRTLS